MLCLRHYQYHQVFGTAENVKAREDAGLAELISTEDVTRIVAAATTLAEEKDKGAKEKLLSVVEATQKSLDTALSKVPLDRAGFKKWMAAHSQRTLLPKKLEVTAACQHCRGHKGHFQYWIK